MIHPLVSIVIPTTTKELDLVRESIRRIEESTYKNVEIVVVNEGKERSEQRNLGIKRAKGEYILYLDSDQWVSPNLISECVSLAYYGYVALYIPERITTPGWFARLRDYERSFYDGTPVDCVRFIRRLSCPLFSLDLHGPEDADHDRRVEGLRGITKNPLYHYDRIGILDYFKKKNYYAKSMRRYNELHPTDKVLNWKYRCFGIFVEDGKWKKIVERPISFLGVMLIVLIRAIIYLKNK